MTFQGKCTHHHLKKQMYKGFTSSQKMCWERNTVHEIPKDTIADQHNSQITQARWYMLVFSLSSLEVSRLHQAPF